ncbi:complex I NDUFA9 subunit family protein [Candidatus Pelagibacter sp.]|nr:complex I NDUFA9 subunit family protein [Candidatus Pelagibacter sp.]
MKKKEILLFGATGQIGRNLIRRLTKNNYKITAVTRNIHRAGYILKTQANPGYLELKELRNFDINKIDELMGSCSICVNLIGILYEKRNQEFNIIHKDFPNMLSQLAKKNNIQKFIHLSSLGIEQAINSKYAMSKLQGEKKIKENFKKSIIIKPSVVYSVDDNFTTNFMMLLNRLPIMPLYYNGKTKFTPIHVSDLVNIIFTIIDGKYENLVLECIGPEILTFKQIIKSILNSINKKRILIPLPYPLAKISAKILQLLPRPLLTEDQLELLKYDNIKTGKYKTNLDLGIQSNKKFRIEIDKYSYNWTNGGQYSKKNNIEITK